MVECGTIDQPPSINNITVWGIVTFVIMAVLGVSSLMGVIEGCGFGHGFYSILLLVGSGFGVAGLIFVILSLVQKNGAHMKIGIICFLISCIIHTVLFILYLVGGEKIYFANILQLLLDIFLCYLFYRQSNGFGAA